MSRRRGIADEQPASLGGWLFADLFLLLIVVGFSAFSANGSDKRPIVETGEATAVTRSSAVLNGSVVAKKQKTDVAFEWGTTPTLTDSRPVTAGGSPISGAQVDTPFQAELRSLEEGTTYYFRAIASNDRGKAVGEIHSFTTGKGVCTEVGAQFVNEPFARNITKSDVRSLLSDLREFARRKNLADPKVAVAEISGWTTDPSGSEGQKNARDLYRMIQKADVNQEFFYKDTALSPWQKSKLKKYHFDVVLYLVDLAQKCSM